jgi:phosphate transport system permease protein
VRSNAKTPRGPRLWHRALEFGIRLSALTSIVAMALIFAFIAREALPLLWEADGETLRNLLLPRRWEGYEEPVFVWQPNGPTPKMNLLPLFVGTLKVTVIAMAVSAPLGIGAAIFVSQYAPRWLRELIKPAIELLAGVPSVVLGFFALAVLATGVQEVLGLVYRLNALVAGLGLSVAVVPVVFTVSEDALQSVPRQLSEASLALGARPWQTTVHVVIPAALPGLVAALVLGFGRAIGETMVVLMASGNAAVMAPFDPTSSARTVTATIASELGEVSQGDPHWRVLFLLGALLFLVTFALNRVGIAVASRIHQSLTSGQR